MTLKHLAYGIALGGALVTAACPPVTNPHDPDASVDPQVLIPATCTTDTDTGTASFTLTHLGLPDADGFDIDHLNNASRPAGYGATVAGCGKLDLSGGRDNALGTIATALAGVIDLETALQGTLVHSLGDGGSAGSIAVSVGLSRLAAGNPANDASICATVTVSPVGGTPQVFDARGAIVDDVVYLAFDDELVFDIGLEVPPSSCTGGTCAPGDLRIGVRGGRARLHLDASHTHVGADSILGGFIFFADDSSAYATANATGFQAALDEFATEVHLDPMFKAMAIQAFGGAMDLHMEVDGSITPCTGANTSVVNRNSVSVALAVSSL